MSLNVTFFKNIGAVQKGLPDSELVADAAEQLVETSVNHLSEIINKTDPEFASRTLIDESSIRRTDILHIEFTYTTVDTEEHNLVFPLFDGLETHVDEVIKHKEQKISLQPIKKGLSGLNTVEVGRRPIAYLPKNLDTHNDEVSPQQREYILPESRVILCKDCGGKGYFRCRSCNGLHEWTCPTCNGQTTVDCKTCDGKGDVKCPKCKGKKEIECRECKGYGKISCTKCHGTGEALCPECNGKPVKKCSKCRGKGLILNHQTGETQVCDLCDGTGERICRHCQGKGTIGKCSRCHGKGEIICTTCLGKKTVLCPECEGEGKVTCHRCKGNGYYECRNCKGNGTIVCDKCSGEPTHYGMSKCLECAQTGHLADISYLDFNVKVHHKVLNFVNESSKPLLDKVCGAVVSRPEVEVYRNVNGKETGNTSDYTKRIVGSVEKHFKISRTDSPFVIKENINYQIISSVEFTCKHIITGKEAKVHIYDVNRNPIVEIKDDLRDASPDKIHNPIKVIGDISSKLLKTKRYKDRTDQMKEVKLFIRLIRSDNNITEKEKEFLLKLGGIDSLSYPEQAEVLELLHCKSMTKMTKNDVTFNDDKLNKTIITRLKELAKIDGIGHPDVESFINQVAALQNSKK